MGFHLRGRYLGDTPAQAAKSITKDEAHEMLLDYIVMWDEHPSEFIASGEVFKYTWNDLVRCALEEIRDYGEEYGKIQWREPAPKASSNSKCCCGKAKCTGCGKCGSKNLMPKGASNRKKAPARKATTSRRC